MATAGDATKQQYVLTVYTAHEVVQKDNDSDPTKRKWTVFAKGKCEKIIEKVVFLVNLGDRSWNKETDQWPAKVTSHGNVGQQMSISVRILFRNYKKDCSYIHEFTITDKNSSGEQERRVNFVDPCPELKASLLKFGAKAVAKPTKPASSFESLFGPTLTAPKQNKSESKRPPSASPKQIEIEPKPDKSSKSHVDQNEKKTHNSDKKSSEKHDLKHADVGKKRPRDTEYPKLESPSTSSQHSYDSHTGRDDLVRTHIFRDSPPLDTELVARLMHDVGMDPDEAGRHIAKQMNRKDDLSSVFSTGASSPETSPSPTPKRTRVDRKTTIKHTPDHVHKAVMGLTDDPGVEWSVSPSHFHVKLTKDASDEARHNLTTILEI